MSRRFKEWSDNMPDDEEDEEIILVSKSELKRDAQALKALGTELIALSESTLARLPLDDDLRDAVMLAQHLKKEGRRRQVQLIGKMLRSRDDVLLRQALDRLKNRHNQQTLLLHKLEALRDQLIEQGDTALSEVITRWPQADRQQLRTMIRNAQKEQAANKPPTSSRQIFRYLRELAEQTSYFAE